MKKALLLSLSALVAVSSAHAWSKKQEGQATLGRMYIEVGGAAQFNKYKAAGASDDPIGGLAHVAFNAPIFKPNVNVLKDVSWFGLDGQVYFNFSGQSVDTPSAWDVGSITNYNYDVGFALVPYLNFDICCEYLQAIKPFGYGRIGYTWNSFSGDFAPNDLDYVSYGFGAGVEVVFTECFSLMGVWNWNGNNQSGLPSTHSVGAELTYWLNGIWGVSLFGDYNFGSDRYYGGNVEWERGATVGIKFRIGFNR